QLPLSHSTGNEPVGVCRSVSTRIGLASVSGVTWRRTVSALVNAWAVALDSRWSSRFRRVRATVATDSDTDISSAPTANATVMRVRSPRRRRWAKRLMAGCRGRDPSGLELVAEAPDRHHVAGVGRIGLDLGAEPPDVHVDEAAVAEVAVAPDPLEEHLAA